MISPALPSGSGAELPPTAAGCLPRFRPRVGRILAWSAANLLWTAGVAWIAFGLQQVEIAPAVLFPIGVGLAVGLGGVLISRVVCVGRWVAQVGAVCLGLLAVVGQDYIGHRHYVRSYDSARRAQGPLAAALAGDEMEPLDFGSYLSACVRRQPLWWTLDVALTAGAALAVAGFDSRRMRRELPNLN